MNWNENETKKLLPWETHKTIFTSFPLHVKNRLEWRLENEANFPQLQIVRESKTDQSGTFKLSMDCFVRINCKMDFKTFPFDEIRCKFLVSSKIFPAEVCNHQYESKNTFSNFELTSSISKFKDLVYVSQINNDGMTNYASEYIPKISEINRVKNGESLKIGNDENYSVFGFEVKLKRHSRPYIWLYFVPSTSVVIIAGTYGCKITS